MPRMIDDATFERCMMLAKDPRNEYEETFDIVAHLESAPSVELLDLGKVGPWSWEDVMELGDANESFVLFSDLQSLVTSNHDDQVRNTLHRYFSMFTEMTVKDVETFMEALKIGRER